MFDRIFNLILVALGVALYWHSGTMTTDLTSGNIGPEILPRVLAIALIITASLNLATIMRKQPAGRINGGNEDSDDRSAYTKFLILVGLLVAYSLLLEQLGYVISTFLFLLAAIQTMERGRLLKSAVISAAFAGGVYLLYVKVALGSLPPLPFLE
ncbi:tripartite tricarboxylate transporter TctB family protein [Hydrogenophaga sp. SL48]|uniref:tripartite tricarboxylate transporter TctB family protein n=1 Tax=Hydrogenophaga sp. SL48 TaxID=2806347 RepID=UPI001F16DE3D|nr:tripartite tricarboxylate transporter TctB family protein [Hydrogenophaga sp. SL48]UJW83141.1 tripartite tricarboxylate transporter TctB family protein [Hydrogenophaga sp. SL48]